MLALIVPVTLEKLPAINEKYDMAKALEDNVLQNYVKASTDAKQEKNPDEILQEKAGFEDDLRIELPDDSEAVSYTHLDVYKRQVQHSLCAILVLCSHHRMHLC